MLTSIKLMFFPMHSLAPPPKARRVRVREADLIRPGPHYLSVFLVQFLHHDVHIALGALVGEP